jgi:small-conductance mechanosensitive channel
MEERATETKNLQRMEQAAQKTSDPEVIEHKAKERFHFRVTREEVFWLVGYGAVLLLVLGAHLFFTWHPPHFNTATVEKLQNYLRGTLIIFAILTGAKVIEVFGLGRIPSRVSRYNLKRIFRLAVVIAVVFVAISVLFTNWYTAVVSLGLISLVLGFALQMPISSFIAWIYILIRAPYRVGDRIKIGDAHGDVIDVSYLDTTLWEFGGEDLYTNHPSGRVIKFPNSTIFSTPVFNYSWPLFPYLWNEIKFQIAYESDLAFVERTMKEVVDEELGEHMRNRVKVYKNILAKTPVDELEVKEAPMVHFRVSDNTWLEAIVRYLVHPRETGRVKTRLIKKMLARLNESPDRVLFPKSNMR